MEDRAVPGHETFTVSGLTFQSATIPSDQGTEHTEAVKVVAIVLENSTIVGEVVGSVTNITHVHVEVLQREGVGFHHPHDNHWAPEPVKACTTPGKRSQAQVGRISVGIGSKLVFREVVERFVLVLEYRPSLDVVVTNAVLNLRVDSKVLGG